MDDVQIRRAVAEDVDGYVACSVGLFAEDAGTHDDTMNLNWPAENAAASFLEHVDDERRLILVADDGGGIGGNLLGVLSGPGEMRHVRVATLVSMYVTPRLRNRGVGSALVEAFTAWARANEADRLSVTAYADNADAIRFYRRHGFAPFHLTLEASME